MKQILLKTWLILLCLLSGAGTMWGAALGTGYTKITNITSLSAGDAVVLYCDNSSSGVTGYSGSDATVSTTASDWIQFVVEKNGSNYYLKNPTDNKYVTAQTSNKFTISATTASGNEATVNNNGVLCINSRYLVKNGNYYRMYTSVGSYQGVFVYKVNSGGSTPTTYTVTVANNITGGTVKASATSATAGTTVNLTATPNAGYEFGSWNVSGATVANATSATTSFTMPAANVNVSATFNKVQGGGEEPSGDGTTYNFADMTDFSSWGTSYEKKTTTFSDGAYVELASANKSTGTITDCPVTKGGDVIFKAPTGKKISSLTFTCTQWTTKTQTITLNTSSNGTDYTATSTTSSNFVLSASNLTDVSAVKFTFSSASNQVGIKSIEVTYADDGGDTPGKPTPTLSFANTTYNATMGEDFTAPTLTNTENVTVTYSSSETGVATVNATTGAVSLVAPGTTTITASFAGNETYNKASASYTLEVAAAPVPTLTTMDEIYAKAQEVNGTETDVNVVFNNWIVSGVNGSNAYVTNGTKGFIIYKSDHNFVAGDILSGTVSAKIKMFNNAAEFTTITSTTEGLTVTKGGSATEQTIAIADLAGINTGALVAYEGLTYHLNGTSPEFSDGENVIVAYKGIINTLPELVEGKTYNIKGVFLMYGTKKEILPRSAEDIKLVEELTKYVVTIETPENGTLTIKDGETVINNGDEVEEGTELTIEVEAADGYRFKNWGYKDGDAAWVGNNTTTFTHTMPSAPCSFKATFELIPTYTINWSVNGTIVKTQDLKEGAEVTAPEAPEDINGKTFTGWVTTPTVDANATPAYVTPSATATGTVTYYAVFATMTGSAGSEVTEELTNSEVTSLSSSKALAYTTEKTYTDGTVDYSIYAYTDNTSRKWIQLKKDQYVYVKMTAPYAIKHVEVTLTSPTNSSGGINDITKHTAYSGTVALCAADCAYTTSSASVASTSTITDNVATLEPTGDNKELYLKVSIGARIWSILVTYGSNPTYSDFTTIPEVSFTSAGTINFVANDGKGNYYATFNSNKITAFPIEPSDDILLSVESVYINADGTITKYDFEDDYSSVNEDMDKVIIPANTGVLLHVFTTEETAPSVTYEYTNAESKIGEYDPEFNMLVPCTKDGIFKAEADDNYYYKLAYGDNTNKEKLGFWWGTEDGSGNFKVKAGGAVLVVPQSAGSNLRGFSFDYEDTLTSLDALEIANDSVIYNIQGQRISRIQQGVNIVNGKKVIR